LPAASTEGCAGAAKIGERRSVFDGTFRGTPIYDRPLLPAGSQIVGPSVIEESGSTTIVPPGFIVAVDGHLVLEHRR
jgi:N-methylhydantoinase A/oxoprolinase/acetone carboxylase beta subunit